MILIKYVSFLFVKISGVCLLLWMLSGCGYQRYLQEEQKLYAGASVEINTDERGEKSHLERQVKDVVRPNPNSRTLGFMYPRLWIHEKLGDPEEESFKWRTQRRFGEEPVIFRREQIDRNLQLIKNRLFNNGYFYATVNYEVKERNRKVEVHYEVTTGKPYRISEIEFPGGDSPLVETISETKKNSRINEGDIYRLDKLKSERQRIENVLRNKGYFYFDSDFLSFQADTSVGDYQAALRLQIKGDAPEQNLVPYTFNRIFVHLESPEGRERTINDTIDTYTENGRIISFIRKGFHFSSDQLKEAITIRPGQLYSRDEQRKTINRLMSIGTFRFANMRVRRPDGTDRVLDANIFITPYQKRSIETELKGVTKTTNYAGPALTATLKNRNWFNGGEQLNVNLRSGIETRLSGQWSGINSWEFGADASVSIPRLIAPSFLGGERGEFLPRTRISGGATMLNRMELYRMYAFSSQFGYTWQPTHFQRHTFLPVSLNFVRLSDYSDEFEARLAENPFLRRSFEEQFIQGIEYYYSFNTRGSEEERTRNFHIQTGIDLAGNLIGTGHRIITGESPVLDEPLEIWGRAYSQYLKAEVDFRTFQKIGGERVIAYRMMAGGGLPYGNSATLPFVKQFFAGGSNSIRAWHPRSLGPGREPPPSLDEHYADRTGDIKLETNLEYRFPYNSWLKGALFADAGNVWMAREDEQRPEAVFDSEKFMDELALGTGKGFRIDATFFILRLDVAFPLHDPIEGWVTDEIDFAESEWRRGNIIYNLAVGYPF